MTSTLHNFVLFGMMFTVVSLGLASVVLFRLLLSHTTQHQRSIRYFIGFFICASLAFIAFVFIDNSRVHDDATRVSSSIALFLNTALYVSALLSLRMGFILRKQPETEVLWSQSLFYVNIVIACVIQHVMFNYFPQYQAYRISIFNAQLILIFLSILPYVSSNVFGEKIMRYTIFVMAGSLVIMTVPLFFEETFEFYNVSVMSAQSLNYHVWTGMLFILLLADSIDLHYKNSVTDTLTGLNNRRFFMQQLTSIQAKATEDSYSSMIICDIDHFKYINDEHGHEIGDHVIYQFARALNAQIRADDVLARIGGEEFAIFLPTTPVVAAEQIAERMRELVQSLSITTTDSEQVDVTASFGVASLFGKASPSDFINAADRAMYQAKEAGRNRVVSLNGRPV